MPVTVTLANAVDREADWLLAEPLAGYPALMRGPSADADAVFDYIGPRLLRKSQAPRQVHVYRESFHERRIATGMKFIRHDLLLAVLWPISNVERPDSTEQQQLDEAIERLVIRVRGTLEDHTHGGRFWTVGESGEIGSTEGIEVRMPEWRTATEPIDAPLAAGPRYVVEIRYPAYDDLTEEI